MPAETPEKIPNTAKIAAIVWWILCVVFFIGIFTPFYLDFFNVDADNWQFATAFFCLVLAFTSLFVAIMYTRRAGLVSLILNKENLLAHWTYSPEAWSRYARKEHKENKRHNISLFLLVAVISVVIGLIFIIAEPGDWVIFALIVLGIIVIAGGSAFLAIIVRYRQNRQRVGEAYITGDAVFLNRELHAWKGFGAALEDVDYLETGRAMPVIRIVYSTPNRYNRQSFTVRVPVPQDHEEEAKRIAAELQKQLKE